MVLKSRQAGQILVCFSVPAAIMAVSYFYMALYYKTLWLFPVVVHENGRYTLLETMFYFRHFLWEVPIKVVYAVFLVGLFHFYGRVDNVLPPDKVISSRLLIICWGLVAAFLTISITLAIQSVGVHEAFAGLLQYRTSEMRPVQFGSHWRNHFLSNIVLFSSSALFILFYRKGHWTKNRYSVLFYLALFLFLLCTFFFGITGDPFFTPSYVLHQLREVVGSDIPVTLLFSIGTLLLVDSLYNPEDGWSADVQKRDKNIIAHWATWTIPTVSITLYLTVKTLIFKTTGEVGEITDTLALPVLYYFAWHIFEHTLDYIFIVLLVSALYLTTLKTRVKGRR